MNGIGLINATGQPAIAGSFHTLVMQPTSLCNLDCTYCYLPDRRSRRVMNAAVAQACAESIALQNSGHPVSVVWHGGEPTATALGCSWICWPRSSSCDARGWCVTRSRRTRR